MKTLFLTLFALSLFSCNGNKKVVNNKLKENISANGNWNITWVNNLKNVTKDNITITFKEEKIGGQAHCNRYFSSYTESKEGTITLSPIGATRMACENLNKEQQYFETLIKVTKKEIINNTLHLYNKENKVIIKAKK